jgi:hypothetical protein
MSPLMAIMASRCAYGVMLPFSSSALSVSSGVMLVLHLKPCPCSPASSCTALGNFTSLCVNVR